MPRPRRIDRQKVLEAALHLVDRDGVDGLSMRRLAAELGVEAMAVYRHLPGKEDVLYGVVELVLSELAIDPDAPRGWETELRRMTRAYRRIMLAHPNVFPLALTMPLSTPLASRPPAVLVHNERLLALFERAGFSARSRITAYRFFVSFLLGHLLVELREVVADPDEPETALRLGLHRLPAQEFPELRAVAPELMTLNRDREFERQLALAIDALRGTLLR